MALEPPRVGPQLIEQEEKPQVSIRDRVVGLNQHLLIAHDFSIQLTEFTRQGAIFGRESIEKTNVDGQPTMTEEQFQKLRELLTQMVDKVMDLNGHALQIIALVSGVSGRVPPPPNWPPANWDRTKSLTSEPIGSHSRPS